ncbi:MAG: CBS domain-containing protein [Bacilli bacterium]|nr:CBS domain-containing protein [Bacilli bacterium]MBO6286255.1 CBS domain-containing protein [Bacilli bacterium]
MKAKELATPVKRVEYLYSDFTIGDAVKKMEKCHYTMIPVIERNSARYLYSVTSGDILHRIITGGDLKNVLVDPLSTVRIERLTLSCNEDVDVTELFELAVNQNYIPLVDNNGTFKGILTRRAILNFLIPTKEGE